MDDRVAEAGRRSLHAGQVVLLVLGLPLVGCLLAGKRPGAVIELPPRADVLDPGPFSWGIFLAGAAAVAAVLAPFLWRIGRAPVPAPGPSGKSGFPWWGWAALALVALAWAFSWGLWELPEGLRRHAFTPLWLGYIGAVNAWTLHRTGWSPLTRRPVAFVALFLVSAGFWWFFEYLNLFVRNWAYLGTGERSGWGYFWASTPAFATVLPAVLSTRDLLASFPRLSAGLEKAWSPRGLRSEAVPWVCLAGGMAGLIALGWRGSWFFPLVWVAPLLVVWAVQGLAGRPSLLDEAGRGDWRPLWLSALSGLVCGFFWELWNWGSLARWEYAIPHVSGLEIFAMPILGYAGYLPFGITCVAVSGLGLGFRQGGPSPTPH